MSAKLSLAVLALTLAAPAMAETPAVVTDIAPVGSLVDLVLGDLGRSTVLLESGGDPHHYQLRPSQARALQQAGLLVWIGPELTPWLERGAATLAPGDSLQLIDLSETRPFDHPHDHGHDDHGGDHHGHDHGGVDPHVWLDPTNAAKWLPAIAERLGRIDPANAQIYAANATAAQQDLAQIDATLSHRLEPVRGKVFAVQHDAYGYFTRHYGLETAVPVTAGDAADSGAAHLRKVASDIRDHGIACLFPEANHSDRLIARLAAEGGARLGAPLDPEGSSMEPGPALYGRLLTGLADSLVACLNAENP